MLKKLIIAASAAGALLLASCTPSNNPPTADETLQAIHDQIVAACKFDATITSIAEVAATITTAINAAAGAAATVAVAVGSTIVGDVCKAVQAQQARASTAQKAPSKAGQEVDVVVNGVTVHGKITQ